MIAVIKSDPQYREVLARVTELSGEDPGPESDAGRELEVLALLLQDYERRAFPLAPPSPIAAIRLRMEQMGLTGKDLIPYLGSRSRVSEVLGGKRPLSLAMIRGLNSGLGIPLESLVSESRDEASSDSIEWDRFPVRVLLKRHWIGVSVGQPKRVDFAYARDVMEAFFKPLGGPSLQVLHRKDQVRVAPSSDRFALAAWAGHVLRSAERIKSLGEFNRADWDSERLRELRSLSRYDVGPRLALQFLAERGIAVVVAQHLPRTRLDGAAMRGVSGRPVIGLTLRHDRLDNFWFTLFHELMHVLRHLDSSPPASVPFMDDFEVETDISEVEREADAEARDALLPLKDWENSAARFVVAPQAVEQLARQVGISEAIVAGRVRRERNNYRILSSMVGPGKVQSLFPEIDWSTESA